MAKRILLITAVLCAMFVVACAESEPGLFGASATAQLPKGLIEIDDEAFEGTGFQTVILPEGLTFIGDRAFADNGALETVIIPESVTSIGEDAFDGAMNLMVLGDPDSFAEDWAKANGFSFMNRALLSPISMPIRFGKLCIPIIFLLPIPEEERERIVRRLRNLRSLRRQDRPEMNVPEWAIP